MTRRRRRRISIPPAPSAFSHNSSAESTQYTTLKQYSYTYLPNTQTATISMIGWSHQLPMRKPAGSRCAVKSRLPPYTGKAVPAARADGVTRHPGAGAAGYRGPAPAGNR